MIFHGGTIYTMGNNYVSWNITDDFDDWITNEDGSVSYDGKLYKSSDELRDFLRTSTFTINDYAISDTILKYSDGAWDSDAKGMEYMTSAGGKYIIELSPSFYEIAFKKKSPTGTVAFEEDYLKCGTWTNSKEGSTLTINQNGTWSMSNGKSGTYEFNKRAIVFNLYENGVLSEAAWDYSYINTPTSGSNGEVLVGGASIHCASLFLQNHKLEYALSDSELAKWVTHATVTDGSSYGKYNKYTTCGKVYSQQNFKAAPVYSTYVRYSFQVLQRCYFVYDANTDEIYIALNSSGGSSYKFGVPTKYAGDKLYSWQKDDGNDVRLQRLVFSSDSAKGGIIAAAEGSKILKYIDVYSYQVAEGNLQTGWNYNRYGNWCYNNGQSSYLNLIYLGPTSFKKFKTNKALYSSKWSIPSSYSAIDNKVITLPFQQTSIVFPIQPGYTIHNATYSSNGTTKSIKRDSITYLSEIYREIAIEGTKDAVTLELEIVDREPEAILYDGENAAEKYADENLFTTDWVSQTDSSAILYTKTAAATFGQTKLAAFNNVRFQPGSGFITHDAEYGTVTVNPSMLGLKHDVCCSTNLDLEYNFTLTYTDVSDWNQSGNSELPKAMLLFCSCDGYQDALTYSSFNTYSFVNGDEIFIIFKMSNTTYWTTAEEFTNGGEGKEQPWHLKILDSTLIPVGSSIKNIGEVSPWVTTNSDGSSFLFWDFGLDFVMPAQNYDLNVYLTDRLYNLSSNLDPFEGIKSTDTSTSIDNYFWILNELHFSIERYAYINMALTKLNVNGEWKSVNISGVTDSSDPKFLIHDSTHNSSNVSVSSSVANSQSKRNFIIKIRTQGTQQTLQPTSSMYKFYKLLNTLYSDEVISNYPGYYRCVTTGGNTGNGGNGGNGGQSVAAISWKQGLFAVDWFLGHGADSNLNQIINSEGSSPTSLNPLDTLSKPGGKGGDGFVGGDGGNGGDAFAGGVGMNSCAVHPVVYLGVDFPAVTFTLFGKTYTIIPSFTLGPGNVSLSMSIPGFVVYLSGGIGGDGGNGGDGWLLGGRGGGSGGGTNGLPKGSFGAAGGCDSVTVDRWGKIYSGDVYKYLTTFKLQKYRGCLMDVIISNMPAEVINSISYRTVEFNEKQDFGLTGHLDNMNLISASIKFKMYIGRNGTDGISASSVPSGMFGMCGSGGAGGTPSMMSITTAYNTISFYKRLSCECENLESKIGSKQSALVLVAEGGSPGSSYTYQTDVYGTAGGNDTASCYDVFVPIQVESGKDTIETLGRDDASDASLFAPKIGACSNTASYQYWETSNCSPVNCCYARVAYMRTCNAPNTPIGSYGVGSGYYGTWLTNCIHTGSTNTTLYYGWDIGCGCLIPLESPFGYKLDALSSDKYYSGLRTGAKWIYSGSKNPQINITVTKGKTLESYLLPLASNTYDIEQLNYPYYSIGAKTLNSGYASGQALYAQTGKEQPLQFLYDGSETAYSASGTQAYYGASSLAAIYNTEFLSNSNTRNWSTDGTGKNIAWASHDTLWERGYSNYTLENLKNSRIFFSTSFILDGSVWPWCGAGAKIQYLGYDCSDYTSYLYGDEDPLAL